MNTAFGVTTDEQEMLMYQGEPLYTFPMIDRDHGWPEGTAKQLFDENIDELIEGVHYVYVACSSPDEE